MTVRKIDNGADWALWRSDVVENNIEQMSAELGRAYRLFTETFTGCNSSLTNLDPFNDVSLKDLPNIFENIKKEDEEDKAFLNSNQNVSGYRFYNVFSLTTPSPLFWELFREIKYIVEQQFDYDGPKWIQCWLNYHKQDEVLDWHNHGFPMHGYVSIRPHYTTTTFGDYEIKNEIGNIYIGPGYRDHKVIVNKEWKDDEPRLTLGYDIITNADRPDNQFSAIPL
tara:strand:- start:311 stop:982 length:672 start_codon:yes stop_codon:yes gene_type:complete